LIFQELNLMSNYLAHIPKSIIINLKHFSK